MNLRMTVRAAAVSLLFLIAAWPALAGQPGRRAARPEISEETKAKMGEMLAQTANESGLSQEEIDAYTGFIKDVSAAGGDRGKINQAVLKTGMTEPRLLYIRVKTDIGCMTAAMTTAGLSAEVFKDVGKQFQPTGDEMELIKKNLKQLQEASFLAEFPMPE